MKGNVFVRERGATCNALYSSEITAASVDGEVNVGDEENAVCAARNSLGVEKTPCCYMRWAVMVVVGVRVVTGNNW